MISVTIAGMRSAGATRPTHRAPPIGSTVLLLFVFACVAPRPPGLGAPVSVASASSEAGVELIPSRAGARAYGEVTRPPFERDPLVDALLHVVDELCRKLARPEVRWDDRLALVARDLAKVAPENQPLDYNVVEFALSHYGIVEPTPHMFVVWTSKAPVDAIVNHVRDQLRQMVEGGSYTRVGIGVAARDQNRSVVAVALQVSAVELNPVPRRLERGARTLLEGRVVPPYDKPEVLVSLEDGSVTPVTTRAIGNRRFNAEVLCGNKAGKIQVEISATGPEGPIVLANFPIWCGKEPPARLLIAARGPQLKEVGAAMGVTKERIRQLEARAMEKLRVAAQDEHLPAPDPD